MRSKLLSASVLFLLASCVVSNAEVVRSGNQCFLEDLSKAPAAAVCVSALRASGKNVTEGDIINCNIQASLLTPIPCPNR